MIIKWLWLFFEILQILCLRFLYINIMMQKQHFLQNEVVKQIWLSLVFVATTITKLTRKTPQRRQWRRSGLLLTLKYKPS